MRKGCNGFTLIELLAAMASAGMLALVIGALLVFGYRGWANNNIAVNMQRDASLAMEAIGRNLRGAVMGEVSFQDSDTLYFALNQVTNIVWVGNQLVLNPGGFPLVRDGVNSFDCVIQPEGQIDVALQLTNSATGNMLMLGTYSPRN